MALLQNLKENKEVSAGTFSCEIDVPLEESVFFSPSFKCGRSNCKLTFWHFCTPNGIYFLFALLAEESDEHSLFTKVTSCSICLIGPSGQTLTSETGVAFNKRCLFPMSINKNTMRSFLAKGTVTVRLSWHPWKSSSLLEVGTQTSQDFISVTDLVPISLLEKLSDDLKCLYDSKIDTDCVMRVSDVQFPAHKAVLSARSSVFAAMFRNETPEKSTGVVDILDVDSVILSDVLKYMYSGKIHGMNTETAAPMYEFADKYAILGLRDHCLCFLKNNMTIDNVCYAAILAHTYGETELEEKVSQFIEDRLEDILTSSSWKSFASTKPSIAMKYLGSSFVACKKNKAKKDVK